MLDRPTRLGALPLLTLSLTMLFPDFDFGQSGSQSDDTETIQSLSASLAELARRIRPSLVQIRTIGYGAVEGMGEGSVAPQRGTGSGVVLDSEGFIVTNAHVVKGARHIEVWLNESNPQQGEGGANLTQKKSAPATLVGLDQDADLAVIKIDRSGLVPLVLADSDALRQGQIVLAFGNPMALEDSVTMGVISSAERQLEPDDASVYIQTDAPINPGNSGGPLVDAQGRLAGINTFILSQSGGSEGIGFAIPANLVKRVYAELRQFGSIHHGHIGIAPLSVTPSLAAGLNLPRDWGVILEDVEPGGPADRAGLQPSDLLVSADGQDLRDLHGLLRTIDRHSVGEVLQIGALRGSRPVEAAVTIEERHDDLNSLLEMVLDKSDLVTQLGVLAIDVEESLLKMIGELRQPAGVLVTARVIGMPGSDGGLEAGDLLGSLNGHGIANVAALRGLLASLPSGSPAVLQVQRGDRLKFVVLDLP
ncbi:MAG: trypsin-like peptidase domain-containing protein [Acidobacteriota bacterium]